METLTLPETDENVTEKGNKLVPYNIPGGALYAVRFEPDTKAVVPMELRHARWTNPALARKAVEDWYNTYGKQSPVQRMRARKAVESKNESVFVS